MPDRRLWRHFDYFLLIAVALIIALGVAMIYSASRGDPEIERAPTNQAVTALLGIVILFIITISDYSLLKGLAWLLYLVILALLLGVLIFGELRFEARRWYNLGGFDFQPGELAKLVLGIVIAAFIADRQGKRPYLETIILSGVLIAPCIILILRQPNLSTALIITFMWATMVFAGGIESRHVGALLGVILSVVIIVLVSSVVLGFDLVEQPKIECEAKDTACQTAADAAQKNQRPAIIRNYQINRIQSFIGINPNRNRTPNPNSDKCAAENINDLNYQTCQALFAFGSGGWLGQGFLQGTQGQLRFLPVRHTDFIFSIIGEELGFLGAAAFVAILMFIIYRALRAAWIAHDVFGRMLCISIAAVFFLQTYINLGMQVGLLPVTGVVLPFVSYGRSNLISAIIAIGLIESVAMRYKKLEF